MKYKNLQILQSTSYDRDFPHDLQMSIDFKSKADRLAFTSALQKILREVKP
jgi:hypothetical protein